MRSLAPALAQSVDPSDLIPDPLPCQDLPHRQGRRPLDPLLPLDSHHRLTTLRRLDLQAVHSDLSMTMGQALAQQNSIQSARTQSELVLALRSLALALAQPVDSSDLIPDPLPVQDLPHHQGPRLLDQPLQLDSPHRLTTLHRLDLQADHFDQISSLLPGLNQIGQLQLSRSSWRRSQGLGRLNQKMQRHLGDQKMAQHCSAMRMSFCCFLHLSSKTKQEH